MWFKFSFQIFFTTKGTKETKGVTKEFLTYVDFLCVLMCLMWFKSPSTFFLPQKAQKISQKKSIFVINHHIKRNISYMRNLDYLFILSL